MVMGRTAFGKVGNIVPAGLNALVAGIGWFAVNSVSGTLALEALFHGPKWLWLLVVVVAQLVLAVYGHNLVQAFERAAFPILGVIFVVGAIVIFSKAHPGAANPNFHVPGAWWIEMSAAWGYAAGWNPYASDYSRYLPRTVSLRSVALAAGLGVFVSCAFLEIAGAAAATVSFTNFFSSPSDYTGIMPTWLGDITLVAIAVGAVAANALNVYSGAMSALATGLRISFDRARALVALTFGVIGFLVALWGLHGDIATKYNDFLLIIAYWITPWVAIVFVDRLLRRGQDVTAAVRAGNRSLAGVIAFVVGTAVAIWLFSNQTKYVGVIPKHHDGIGDITPIIGFLLAGALYAVLVAVLPGRDRPSA
jgi:purine-cytosine permease-like protein